MNARVAGLFLLVLLEYLNGKSVVHATSRRLDMALHWLRVGAAPLMSPRQDETNEPLLYAGWMAGPYRVEDATFKLFSKKLLKSVGCTKVAYMNARVAGLFMLVLLEYPNGKGVVHATSRGLDMALHWSGVGAVPLMSPRQNETSEPLLYAGWMAGPY
ncbi:hypothetical protein Tco_0664498 [Tanacetum coccineum]